MYYCSSFLSHPKQVRVKFLHKERKRIRIIFNNNPSSITNMCKEWNCPKTVWRELVGYSGLMYIIVMGPCWLLSILFPKDYQTPHVLCIITHWTHHNFIHQNTILSFIDRSKTELCLLVVLQRQNIIPLLICYLIPLSFIYRPPYMDK